MVLKDLGYYKEIESFVTDNGLEDFTIARVISEHKDRYIVSTGDHEYEAEITGNLRYSASSRADFPVVGDWVVLNVYDTDMALIHQVLPRKTLLERKAAGKYGEKQIISSNIDIALIVQSFGDNFNINRLERYLSICYSASIEPVFVISKIDLGSEEEIKEIIKKLDKRNKKIRTIFISNQTRMGIDEIEQFMQKGKTYCLIGSSGVGKSSLLNNLQDKEMARTGEISQSTGKGRHITSHRELFVLGNGAIVIDNPGMRELGMTDSVEGIEELYEKIIRISRECKFADCTHLHETGCAVKSAIEKGTISKESFENFKKMEREQQWFQQSLAEKRKKDREFGKHVKAIMREKKSRNKKY